MVERYIIMCGGNYKHWETPRHLSLVMGEELVARTIRLLKENGITDINISTHNPVFEKFGVPILKHDNLFEAKYFTIEQGNWFNCFYPTDEPVCYIFGDVFFSDEAIKTIVETETDDIEFFGSRPPFADCYIKDHEEPFALKVVNQKHLREAIAKTRELEKEGKFWRKPIMWELWTVIKDTPLQVKKGEYPAEYVVINDYTCDVDWKQDIINIERMYKKMIKVEVTEPFTLAKFNELKNIKRKALDTLGQLNVGDVFECTEEMFKYLDGENAKGKSFVKLIEVIPAKVKLVADTKAETENIIPLDKNNLEKIGEQIEKHIKPKTTIKKTVKKKTSKK